MLKKILFCDNCLISIAQITANKQICDLLTENTDCIATVAHAKKDISLCDLAANATYCQRLYDFKNGKCWTPEEAENLNLEVPCVKK